MKSAEMNSEAVNVASDAIPAEVAIVMVHLLLNRKQAQYTGGKMIDLGRSSK